MHLLFFWFRLEPRLPDRIEIENRPIVLVPLPPPTRRGADAVFWAPRPVRGHVPRRVDVVPRSPEPVPRVVPPVQPPLELTQADTLVSLPRTPAGPLGPGLGDGRLWVQPLPLPPRDLARRLKRSEAELVDSVVRATIQAFLDSIALQPDVATAPPPDWTTKIAGSKFGMDSKNIYIAGLRIPVAVLALLPLQGGNQANALDHSADQIYRDLRRAAARAATLDDFKRAIRDLREQKAREREFERAQRSEPDSGGVSADSL